MSNATFTPRPAQPRSNQLRLRLERRTDGALLAVLGDERRVVHVQRCFPWSEPGRFISLRDADDEEFVLVPEPSDLDDHARGVLEEALADAGFLFEVTTVLDIEEEVELRHWRVETVQGPRRFQTRLDEWPRVLPDGGVLIRDVTGDFYHVRPSEVLDRRSRELLWAFID